MKIIALDDVEVKQVNMEGASGAWKQLPLGRQDGAPVYSYRVFTVEPGGYTPYHQHPYEHMNYIIEGRAHLSMRMAKKHLSKQVTLHSLIPMRSISTGTRETNLLK